MALTVAQMVARLTADTSGFYRAMAVANASMIRSGALISRVAAGAGLAVLGMGFVSVRAAGNFQQAMNIVQAVTGSTGKEMDQLGKKALQLGRDFKLPNVSAKDAADAMVQLGKAGFTTKQILDSTRGVLQLGLAANIGFADAANIAARTLKMFNLEADQSARVANLLAAAANKSTAEITDLAYGMQSAGGQFQDAGYSVETLTTALALLVDKGVSGEYAGTALKTMLIRLQGPTKDAAAEMKKLGIDVFDASGKMRSMPAIIDQFARAFKGATDEQRQQALITIFGVRANQAMSKLLQGGVPVWEKYAKAITGTNAAQEMAEARTKGFNGALQAVGSAVETLAIELGTALLPSLEKAARRLANFVTNIDPNKIIAVFSTAFSGVKQVIEKFANFLGTELGRTLAAGAAGTYVLVRAFIAMKAAVALLNAAMMAMTKNPFLLMLVPLGFAVGQLAMKFVEGKIKAAQFDAALRAAAGGANELKDSLDRLKASETGLEGAKINLIRATQASKVALAAWKKAVDDSGAGSAAAKAAYLDYRESLNAVKAAQDGVTAAEKEHKASIKGRNEELNKGTKFVLDTAESLKKFNSTSEFAAAGAKILTDKLRDLIPKARETAAKLADIDPAASKARAKAALLAEVAIDLAQKLGRVPTKKEIIAEAKAVNFEQFYAKLLEAQRKMEALKNNAGGWGQATGMNLGQGLVNGIQAKMDEVGRAAAALGQKALSALNWASGVSSPSKKTQYTGEMLGKGLIIGFLLGSRELPAKMDEVLRKTLEAARTRIQQMQTEFSSMFSRMVGDILTAFDAATAAFKTKSEKALEALIAKEAADAAKKRIEDLKAAIKKAGEEINEARREALAKGLQIEQEFAAKMAEIDKKVAEGEMSPEEGAEAKAEALRKREEELAQLRYEMAEREKELQRQLEEAKIALQEEKDAQALEKKKAALEKKAAEERKQYEAARARQRRNLEDQLADLEEMLAKHPERWKFYQNKVLKLLEKYNIDYKTSGRNVGKAFAEGLRDSIDEAVAAAKELADAVAQVLKTKSPSEEGPMSDLDKWWEGFAPTLLSGLDNKSIENAMVRMSPTPGLISAPRTSSAAPIYLTVNVEKAIGSDLDQAGQELAEPVRRELLTILSRNGYR